MRTLRRLAWIFVLWLPITSGAQNPDFGSKFFDDLRSLFGRLQKSELERAFQRAKPIHCSDLVEEKGEWKQVAFLNDDRKLGDWHYDSIDEVKRDLVRYVFSGTCRGEQGPVRVATSYPVRESVERFQDGKIPFSKIVMRDNAPVSVVFDRQTDAYTFQLPYLYIEGKTGPDVIYTLTPPLTTSKAETEVTEEFRCKALSDAELTYRFLLCRTRVVASDPRIQRQNERQVLGNAAYYIFSDGKEASSSVKLRFGETDSTPAPTPEPLPATERKWQPGASQARLVSIGQGEFRLRFNPQTWKGRIDKPQLLVGQMLSDFVAASAPRNKEYCVWRPGLPNQVNRLIENGTGDLVLYSLAFRKELQAAATVVFEMENEMGFLLGTLECYFPQNQTPADVAVERWVSIVGRNIELDVPSN